MADDQARAALLASEPLVADRSYTLWEVYSPSRDGVAFVSEQRAEAETWMRRLVRDDNDYVLRSTPVRSRSETWWGASEVIPWHSPCGWVGAVDTPSADLRCQSHGWHGRDEPVPAEFWRPVAQGDTDV